MKEKILKLAKRLEKFTPDDIQCMTGYKQNDVLEILDEFVERNQIKKLSKNQYIFIKSYFIGKLDVSNYSPQGIHLSNEDIEVYKNADRYAKKFADKCIKILESSNGLKGKELTQFVEKWNLKNPTMKTSVTRIHAARKKILEEGIKGLLGTKFKSLSDRKKINETIYVYFRELYLSPQSLTSAQALNLAVRKYLEECPEFDITTLAQEKTYAKRLRSEYTVEEVDFYRSNYITKGFLKELKQKTSEE